MFPPIKKCWQDTMYLIFHQAGGKTVLASSK
ncbi:urease accessory protein UreD, partial [Klebsiella pneumoniae]|nr:urease accessory protein UreD [Klebsiella pneumoniae]